MHALGGSLSICGNIGRPTKSPTSNTNVKLIKKNLKNKLQKFNIEVVKIFLFYPVRDLLKYWPFDSYSNEA